MSKETIRLTLEGKLALEEELHELESVRRPAMMQRVIETQADSNLEDGGVSADAANELAYLERRMHEIDLILHHAVIIPETHSARGNRAIHLGSHVVVREPSGDEQTWCIVDSAEANARTGKISSESPVGAALLGKKQGQTVVVRVPGGETNYTILDVR